jgi:hypothetical protein
MENATKKPVLSYKSIPYVPNKNSETDYENFIHEQMENNTFGEIFTAPEQAI